jgi:hypothetical protein
MILVTFAEHFSIGLEKSAGASNLLFEAGREYVIAQQHFNRLMENEAMRQRLYKWSQIDNRIPFFNATAPKKPGTQRVLFYNGSGGYGDQIMSWPFAAILKSHGYDVHVMIDPGNKSCWFNFNWIKALHDVPMQYEEFKMFDHYAVFETVVNAEEHSDQIHPLDQMLLRVGIRPESVDPRLKALRPSFTYLETQAASIFQNRKMGMYQLAAANPVRCLPANDSAYLISKVAEAFPDIHWLALYDKFIPKEYIQALQCKKCNGAGKIQVTEEPQQVIIDIGTKRPEPNSAEIEEIVNKIAKPSVRNEICQKCSGSGTLRQNIQLYNQPILRELWALSQHAKVIIGPDSMMVHVAGSLEVPCVGLWGPCDPKNRTKYYKHHFPIWKKSACNFSPCFAYSSTFPRYCPPRPNRNVCECLGAISHAEVIEEVKKAIVAK